MQFCEHPEVRDLTKILLRSRRLFDGFSGTSVTKLMNSLDELG